jgi:hypothetical protein
LEVDRIRDDRLTELVVVDLKPGSALTPMGEKRGETQPKPLTTIPKTPWDNLVSLCNALMILSPILPKPSVFSYPI